MIILHFHLQLQFIYELFHINFTINILLTQPSQPAWENLNLGRVYRPQCVRSVLKISVKILSYRPPARLIRAKLYTHVGSLEIIRLESSIHAVIGIQSSCKVSTAIYRPCFKLSLKSKFPVITKLVGVLI